MKSLMIFLLMICSSAHAEWISRDSGTTADLVDVCFVDKLHGWAIGNDGSTPVIIATEDGGVSWHQQECPDEMPRLNKIFFLNNNIGFIASECQGDRFESHIFSTDNGGDTWKVCYTDSNYYQFNDIFFIDELTGWVAGVVDGQTGDDEPVGGVILLTTDGGSTWKMQLHVVYEFNNSRIDAFEAIAFSDNQNGWALGNDLWKFETPATNVYHTGDGGLNWEIIGQIADIHSGISRSLNVSGSDTLWSSFTSTYKSFDGGITWAQTAPRSMALSFSTATSGWALIGEGIYFTGNAGESWDLQFSTPFRSIDSPSQSFACAVGENGIVATYKDAPVIIATSSQPATFTLDQNYPNPFNASTTISYTLSTDSPVSVKLYAATGQLVRTLCDHYMPAGRHSLVVDGSDLPSGMYLVRVEAQNTVQYRRMLLMK